MINGDVPAKFNPDVYGTNPGEPLKAQLGDLVSWNNQTTQPHQIRVGPLFTTDPIEAGKSSTPGWVVELPPKPGDPITYVCTKHNGESGTITVAS
jgi:plastocyanin